MAGWLMGILLVSGSVALAIVGTLLSRRLVGVEVLKANNEVAGFIYAVIGVVYAVLLGFSAIIVWEQYERARQIVEQEANQLADLYRNAQSFPESVQRQIEGRLRTYAQVVAEKEWPAMAERKTNPDAWGAYADIWRTYHEFKPENEHQKIWYVESLRRLNQLGDQRRLRLLMSREGGVPSVMWVVLLGAGVVTIGYTFLFGTRSTAAHVLMTTSVAAVIALVMLSILALHRPFAAITRLDPDAFHQVIEIINSEGPPAAVQRH